MMTEEPEDRILEFYRRAWRLREARRVLEQQVDDLLKQGKECALVHDATDGLDAMIQSCRGALKKSLDEYVQREDYPKVKEIVRLLENPLQHDPVPSPLSHPVKKKQPPHNQKPSVPLYSTPLPASIYAGCDSLSALLRRVRGYREEHGEQKLTWERLAHAVDTNGGYVRTIACGYIPSEDFVSRIATALGGDQEKFIEIMRRGNVLSPKS